MVNSPTETLRKFTLFMRGVAATVALTFSALILAPTAQAVQQYDWSFSERTDESVEARLSQTMLQVKQLLEQLDAKQAAGQEVSAELAALEQAKAILANLDEEMTQKLSETARNIRDKGLPEAIRQRHQEMTEQYRQEMATLRANLDAIDTANNPLAIKQAVEKAKTHVKSKYQKRPDQVFDEADIRSRGHKPNPDNKPKQRPADYRGAGLFSNPYPQLAALGDFTFDQLPGANDPAYLGETDEVVLTQPIRDKAAELQHDPVKIYHWVRNRIEWIPTWGAVQNAELTLSAQRGNAMDIASLTLALLRASGIPSRYVHGTIELSAARFNNWAGGFEDSFAAADYAASGGIPVGTVESGGQVSHIQIEHVWVEAAIDYHPSRGAINLAADSWVAMDPSYKQYEYLQGLDVVAISGIDAAQLAQDTAATGTINETEGWVSGLDPSSLTAAQEQAQSALESYITDHLTDPTVGDVIGGRKTIVEEYPILPSALPNHIVTEGARYATLPAGLQQRVSYTLANANDSVALTLATPITLPWSRINNENLSLSFKPATAADEQALQAMLPEGEITDISQLPGSLPTYINVIPELKLNGETILTSDPVGLGQPVAFKTRISYPGRSKTNQNRYDLPAGSYLSVQAIGQVVSPEKLQALQARLEQTKATLESQDSAQIAALTREEILGDMFYAGTLGYYAQLIAMGHIAALTQHANASLSAGYGTLGYEPKVNYFFGLPTAIESGGITLDIPWSMVSHVSDGDKEKRKQYNLQWGMIGSALEHAEPEQMFQSQDTNDPKPNAISAVKALQIASAEGQRIYQITQANMDTALPNIHHDGKGEIEAALQVGMTVITHTDSVSVPGWTGGGYIILDPEDNTGAYKISGGANGAFVLITMILLLAVIALGLVVILSGGLALGPILLTMFTTWNLLSYVNELEDITNSDVSQEEKVIAGKKATNMALTKLAMSLLGYRLGPEGLGVRIAQFAAWFGSAFLFLFNQTRAV